MKSEPIYTITFKELILLNLVFDIPYPAGVYVLVCCVLVSDSKVPQEKCIVYRATVLGISNALCCC